MHGGSVLFSFIPFRGVILTNKSIFHFNYDNVPHVAVEQCMPPPGNREIISMLGTITSHDDDLGPDSEMDEAKIPGDDDKIPAEPPITAKSESDQSKSSEQPKKTIPISEKIDKFAQKIKEVQEREREEEEREKREKGLVF